MPLLVVGEHKGVQDLEHPVAQVGWVVEGEVALLELIVDVKLLGPSPLLIQPQISLDRHPFALRLRHPKHTSKHPLPRFLNLLTAKYGLTLNLQPHPDLDHVDHLLS